MPKLIAEDVIIRILELNQANRDLRYIAKVCGVSQPTVASKIKQYADKFAKGELDITDVMTEKSLYCPVCFTRISVGCTCYDDYPEKRHLWSYLD